MASAVWPRSSRIRPFNAQPFPVLGIVLQDLIQNSGCFFVAPLNQIDDCQPMPALPVLVVGLHQALVFRFGILDAGGAQVKLRQNIVILRLVLRCVLDVPVKRFGICIPLVPHVEARQQGLERRSGWDSDAAPL